MDLLCLQTNWEYFYFLSLLWSWKKKNFPLLVDTIYNKYSVSVVSLLLKIRVRLHGHYSHLAGCPVPSSMAAQQASDGFHQTGLSCGSSHHSGWYISTDRYFTPLWQWSYSSLSAHCLPCQVRLICAGNEPRRVLCVLSGRSGCGLVGFWEQLAVVGVDLCWLSLL